MAALGSGLGMGWEPVLYLLEKPQPTQRTEAEDQTTPLLYQIKSNTVHKQHTTVAKCGEKAALLEVS